MKQTDQVCTLDQAKRLKELGVRQDASIFWWYHNPHAETTGINYLNMAYAVASAFTSSELGHMFPPGYYTWFDGTYWHCGDDIGNERHMIGFTEAETRAAELISLLESGLFTADEVNKRIIV